MRTRTTAATSAPLVTHRAAREPSDFRPPPGSGASRAMDVAELRSGGSVLSTVAEVVEQILFCLPTKSLQRSASVCRLWSDCARRVLRRHRRLSWITTKGHAYADGEHGQHFLVNKMIEELEEVYVLPETVLYMAGTDTFCVQSSSRWRKERRDESAMKSKDAEVATKFEKLLPMNCKLLGISCPGIVYTPMGNGKQRPLEVEDGIAGFALLLPKIEGVTIRCFHLSNKDLKNNTFDQRKLQAAGLLDNPDLRTVLLFGYNTYKPPAVDFIQRLTKPINGRNTIVVGGYGDRVFSPSSESIDARHMYGTVGLSFSGKPIQAASILLDEDVVTPESVETAMKRLKAANIPEHNTVGFMCACIGRGQNYYSMMENVEADAFRKQFPNIPLFGFFGNGEIGCDRIVTDNFSLRECSSSLEYDELIHSYTTVMVLLHLGPLK
ncbi:F-box only protein 22 [Amblyraja radiata]|uniref:F-box only protein 22 n=1 Tax=Amblyraja radiata TaxID=386614 RepID=UPI001401C5F3|nr:F-box only protein 22 [Amblyraja radiata]